MGDISKSVYGCGSLNGKMVSFGFTSIGDWLDSVIMSFPTPWRVADLGGKYYGTLINDADNREIMSVWLSLGRPSERQRGGMTDAEWADYCCDTHWESEAALQVASLIVSLRNIIADDSYCEERKMELRALVVSYADWTTGVYEDVKAGGRERRLTPKEFEIVKDKQ